jgi:hypothetical protein
MPEYMLDTDISSISAFSAFQFERSTRPEVSRVKPCTINGLAIKVIFRRFPTGRADRIQSGETSGPDVEGA